MTRAELRRKLSVAARICVSLRSYLHLLHGLHVDAAALAALHQARVEGIHQDDPSQARRLLVLHVLQEHLSLFHFVADDRGDVG